MISVSKKLSAAKATSTTASSRSGDRRLDVHHLRFSVGRASDRSGLSSPTPNSAHFSLTRCRLQDSRRPGESAGPEFRPVPAARGTQKPPLERRLEDCIDDFSCILRNSRASRRRWFRGPGAGLGSRLCRGCKKKAAKDDAAKPNLVASFGDWGVFVSQAAKGRICYTLAQPKTREPDGLKRDPAYAFISDRPAEGVRNEVSFIMGFDVAGGTDTEAKADSNSDEKPALRRGRGGRGSRQRRRRSSLPSRPSAIRPSSSCPRAPISGSRTRRARAELIDEMRKGAKLEIKAASMKGNVSTDTYSLSGFSQAMERLQKECPSRTQANIQQ